MSVAINQMKTSLRRSALAPLIPSLPVYNSNKTIYYKSNLENQAISFLEKSVSVKI